MATVWRGPKFTHPVPVPIVRLLTCKLEVVIEEATTELVKNWEVERVEGMLDKYPADPSPTTVDIKRVVDTYPMDPRPPTVESRFAEERNPAV